MRFALSIAAGVLLAGLAQADIITLKDGRVIEGDVIEQDSVHVKVKVKFGAITLDRDKIESIEEKLTPEQEYADRLKKLDAKNVSQQLDLAEWADSKKLEDEAIRHFMAAFDLDDTSQRAIHGMEKKDWHLVEGKWQDPDTYYAGKGWVRFEGKWTHPLEYGWRLSQQIRQKMDERVKTAKARVTKARNAKEKAKSAAASASHTIADRTRRKEAAEQDLPDAERDVKDAERSRASAERSSERARTYYNAELAKQRQGQPNAADSASASLAEANRVFALADFELKNAEQRVSDLEKTISSAANAIEGAEAALAKAEEAEKAAAEEEAEAAGVAQQAEEDAESARDAEEKARKDWDRVKPK